MSRLSRPSWYEQEMALIPIIHKRAAIRSAMDAILANDMAHMTTNKQFLLDTLTGTVDDIENFRSAFVCLQEEQQLRLIELLN
jgi:hypothetical protein